MAEFTYNASALGAGGVLKRGNVNTVIPSLASVALAPTGGEGRSVVSNYYSEELAFDHAETRVVGLETAPGAFTTSTYVFIKGLRVFDRLTIERLKAVVTSTRGMDLDDDDHEFELSASYKNVVFRGVELAPEIDLEITNCRRYADLQKKLSEGPRYRGIDAAAQTELMQHVQKRRAVQASAVKNVKLSKRIGEVTGHKMRVPRFGTIRFGELMFKPGRRRLNLLRFEFDPAVLFGMRSLAEEEAVELPVRRSRAMANFLEEPTTDGGSMTVASVEGNGCPLVP